MKFIVPISYTVIGYVFTEAENLEEAKKKGKSLQEKGVSFSSIQDPQGEVTVFEDEIEEAK